MYNVCIISMSLSNGKNRIMYIYFYEKKLNCTHDKSYLKREYGLSWIDIYHCKKYEQKIKEIYNWCLMFYGVFKYICKVLRVMCVSSQ